MSDQETEEFYAQNKEIIDRIIAEKTAKASEDPEERFRRDYLRTLDALDELRDTMTGFASRQTSYADKYLDDEFERIRARRELESERARLRAEEARLRLREEAYRARDRAGQDFDEVFGFLADPAFQRHIVGAGMELFAAINAMIQSGPFPETIKTASRNGDISRNTEFCRKNPDCSRKGDGESVATEKPRTGGQRITVVSKDSE